MQNYYFHRDVLGRDLVPDRCSAGIYLPGRGVVLMQDFHWYNGPDDLEPRKPRVETHRYYREQLEQAVQTGQPVTDFGKIRILLQPLPPPVRQGRLEQIAVTYKDGDLSGRAIRDVKAAIRVASSWSSTLSS